MTEQQPKDEILEKKLLAFNIRLQAPALEAKILSRIPNLAKKQITKTLWMQSLPWFLSAAAVLLCAIGFGFGFGKTQSNSGNETNTSSPITGRQLALYQYVGLKNGQALLKSRDENGKEARVDLAQDFCGFRVREIMPERVVFENDASQKLYLYLQISNNQ